MSVAQSGGGCGCGGAKVGGGRRTMKRRARRAVKKAKKNYRSTVRRHRK